MFRSKMQVMGIAPNDIDIVFASMDEDKSDIADCQEFIEQLYEMKALWVEILIDMEIVQTTSYRRPNFLFGRISLPMNMALENYNTHLCSTRTRDLRIFLESFAHSGKPTFVLFTSMILKWLPISGYFWCFLGRTLTQACLSGYFTLRAATKMLIFFFDPPLSV